MKFKLLATTLLMFSTIFSIYGQDLKSLTIDDLMNWNYLKRDQISRNGEFVSYEITPLKGDGKLMVWNKNDKKDMSFKRATRASFSPESNFIAFKIKPYYDTVRELKLKKTKKDKLPKDSLGVYLLETGEIKKFERVKSFTMPKKGSSWMAWLNEKKLKKKEEVKEDTASGKEQEEPKKEKKNKKKKTFDKNAPKSFELVVYNPITDAQYTYDKVTEYEFSEKGNILVFIRQQNDSLLRSAVVKFDTKNENADTIFINDGLSKKITIDHKGEQIAFIHSEDSIKEKVYSLKYYDGKEVSQIVDTLTEDIQNKWTVSENGRIYFSKKDKRLFFGVAEAPKLEPKDTLLDEEKVNLDLWSWTDGKLQPEQLANKDRELKRTYLTYFDVKSQKVVQLENEALKSVYTCLQGDGSNAIGYDYNKYERIGSWEMPYYKDIYAVDMETGKRELVLEKIQSSVSLSNSGNFIRYFSNSDSSWHVYNIKTKAHLPVTEDIDVPFDRQTHDYPNEPSSYGSAGWTADDKWLLVYDEFDIWQIDPTGKKEPANLTNGFGRKNNIEFRRIRLDMEEMFIDPKEDILLAAFNKKTKESGFYTVKIGQKGDPQKLIMGAYKYYRPIKAELSENIIIKRSTYREYADVYYSNVAFKDIAKISNTNPQQKDYKWGNVELVKWITTEGTVEEGLLYKPENFDPNKKYPMMVYFYRLYSDQLNSHWTPGPSRSIINPTFYASNDYFVFIPNIRYKVGYPGESAYNYVVSGVTSLLNKHSFIDKDRVGIQGQSWGGYEVAYIVTKTDMFAAASAGAPVSNMTSAYGGIRWTSGMSRMFQYEETQSRIGGTLWEKPLNYIENSPVFYAPKVNTPLLIRHNDKDGAVPWYQGIEYFVALRRLNKPVWLLNYNGGPHNEKSGSPNRKDLSIRMKQFFDHYLKDAPAPVWMKEGIPAVKKGKTMGYEIEE
ncbi:MAG: acylaminoacyl-peptidase [Salinivirgaceae bacterium]|nr:MAG: acylaminoacyl-peptidase [Salinivirgaceae bacterium]